MTEKIGLWGLVLLLLALVTGQLAVLGECLFGELPDGVTAKRTAFPPDTIDDPDWPRH